MPTTQDNLKEAFSGESQAFQKYTAFAEKAEREGLKNIARLFRTTAQAERIHASGHLKAKRMFKYAVDAEAVHAKLYKLALEAAQKGQDLSVTNFFLCPVCGYIEFDKAPEECPICGAKGLKFVQVSSTL
jgi:rubrerythrin